MEFRRFLHLIMLLPTQIVRSGRRIIYRIMGYNFLASQDLTALRVDPGDRSQNSGETWIICSAPILGELRFELNQLKKSLCNVLL
jgi:hypothetical protein